MIARRPERRFAAILVSDVAGYSRLMGRDEIGTLSRLQAHRRELIEPLVAERRGQIVNFHGDNAMCEFPSAVDAVEFAVAMQRALVERERDTLEGERIRFRVGVHVGEVVLEGDDLYGDTVNVAARLERLAEPGGICVSATVREEVRGRLPFAFEDLGERWLRNIDRPVRIYRFAAEQRATQDAEPPPSAVRERVEGELSISLIPTFASNWLAPRLRSFQEVHPGLAVRIEASHHVVDFARGEEVDVGIRSSPGPSWPGLEAHRLFPVRFTPLLSPGLLRRAGGGPLAGAADLLRLPLLNPSDPWWAAWFELAGLPAFAPSAHGGIHCDSQQIEGSAAIAGQGVGILTPEFWAAAIAAGQLVQPVPLVGHAGSYYWLVYPSTRRQLHKIQVFHGWLLEEVRRAAAVTRDDGEGCFGDRHP